MPIYVPISNIISPDICRHVNMFPGAVGLSVGGVKWVAGKSIDAGSAVVTTTKNVASKVPVHIPKWKAKAKSE